MSPEYFLSKKELTLSEVVAAIQTPDRASCSGDLQAFGIREYARIRGLELSSCMQSDNGLTDLFAELGVSPGEQNLTEEWFYQEKTDQRGILYVKKSKDNDGCDSIFFRGEWMTRARLGYTFGVAACDAPAAVCPTGGNVVA